MFEYIDTAEEYGRIWIHLADFTKFCKSKPSDQYNIHDNLTLEFSSSKQQIVEI